MTFAALSVTWVLVGIAALAGILYLLQRLRVQHREVQVPTTLFWKEAVEEARARVFVKRFRHPWAWVLLVLLCGLLWLGVADPRGGGDDAQEHLVLIDGSAAMARGDRFERARERALTLVASLPTERRTVVLCGAMPTTVLRPGEHVELLRERLQGASAEACPSTVARELHAFAGMKRERGVAVAVVSDFPQVPPEELWADGVAVTVSRDGDVVPAANSGIVEVGVAEAASGVYDAVDVRIEVAGGATPAPRVTLDGAAFEGTLTEQSLGTSARAFVLRDLPATGQRVEVSLPGGDALALDDRASVRLPVRRRIRVALQVEVPSLRRMLALDPAVELVTGDADVVVRASGGDGPEPALELTDGAAQEEAFLLQHDADRESGTVVTEALALLGLDQIDAMGLASEAARPISLGARPGSVRKVMVWGELFSDRYDFTRSRAFPIFMARTVRWLSAESGFPRHVAAGEETNLQGVVRDADGRRHDPVGEGWTPASAGEFVTESGTAISAALSAPVATMGVASAGALPAADNGGAGADWVAWIGLAALGLLSLEWFLFRRGRMP